MHSKNAIYVASSIILLLATAGCSTPAQREAKYMKRGIAYFQQGDYENARLEFKNAGSIKPTDPEVRYRLALIDEAQGELRNAFIGFNRAVEQNDHYSPAQLKISQYYIAAGQLDEGAAHLKIVLADHPDDAEGHALLAATALRQHHDDDAEKEARFALAKDPANTTAYSVLTGLYVARDDKAKVAETLDAGIARNPTDANLLQLKIAVYQKFKDTAKVVEAYDALFKLRPKERQYRAALADLYVADNRIDDAEASLRAGVAALPNDWDMKRMLVNFLSEHRDVDVAEKEIRGYLQANPDHDELYFWLADLYVKHQAVDRAIALLQEVVAKDKFEQPGLNARTSLARISFARGDRDLAARLVAIVLERAPDNPEALFMRAGMSFDAGRYQGAVSDLRTLLREQPRSKEALQLMAETLVRQGRPDLAIDTLSQLVELDPQNLGARVRLAQMVHLNGGSKQALEMLATVTRVDPVYAVGWESTARIAIDMKDWESANIAIGKLAAISGQAMTATYLRGQVAAGQGQWDDAIRLYATVISADPNAPLADHAVDSYVGASRQTKHLDVAAHYLETLKTDNPTVATALGEIYLELNNPVAATPVLDGLIASKVARPEPYLDRARLALRDRNVSLAIETLRKGQAAVQSDFRIPMMLADLLGANGHYEEAESIYEDLLSRDPVLDVAANNMAELIADYQFGDPAALEKARRVAERFQASTNPLLLDTLGWVYYRQGNIQQALIMLERAVGSGGDVPPQVHYHYGVTLLKADRKPLAKSQLQMAVKGNGNYPGIDEARKELLTL